MIDRARNRIGMKLPPARILARTKKLARIESQSLDRITVDGTAGTGTRSRSRLAGAGSPQVRPRAAARAPVNGGRCRPRLRRRFRGATGRFLRRDAEVRARKGGWPGLSRR